MGRSYAATHASARFECGRFVLRYHGVACASGRIVSIAVGIHRLPPPGVAAHRVDAQLRAPAEQRVRERRFRVDLGYITGAPVNALLRDPSPPYRRALHPPLPP